MTAAVQVRIAEAVAEELRNHTFTLDPTIARDHHVSEMALTDLEPLLINVVYAGVELDVESRTGIVFEVRTAVAVRQRLGVNDEIASTGRIDNAEFDRLQLLVQEIVEFFHARPLAKYQQANWSGTEFWPVGEPFISEHRDNMRQFTGVVVLTHRVHKTLARATT